MMLIIILACLTPLINGYRNSYDFIVVGSGAGGSTVAGRLAESKFSVLLLESGGFPAEGYDVPALLSNGGVTFNYPSVPQKHSALVNNGVINVISGRVLGGTTAMNYMMFNRGHPRDWDQWASVTGDLTWSYANMLKYMKKSEDYQGDFPSDQHGSGGPITVSRPKYSPGLKEAWLEAGRELGYSAGDPNGPQTVGFSAVEYSKKRGRGVSSFVGYVKPKLDHGTLNSNLDVLMNANATQIIFANDRAVAVRVHTDSTSLPSEMIFRAEKEIIVSAGTYNSPLLLQRSGVGPKELLRAANIPIVKELPVGKNFQDHPAISINFAINDSSLVMIDDRDLNPETWQYYLKTGDGPFSSTRGSTGQAFLASSVAVSEGNSNWPDYQLVMAHGNESWVPMWSMGLTTQSLLPGEVHMSTYMFIGRAKSRGTVKINPKDIFGNPLIDLGFLSDERDVQTFLDGIQNIFRIHEGTEAYRKLGTRFLAPLLPACDKFTMRSNLYWKCFMTQTMQGGCLNAGTNKMGKINDPTAVVDPQLRVIGLDGLRVVDASVMPFIINGNTQAGIYGLAEKAADMILKHWKNISYS